MMNQEDSIHLSSLQHNIVNGAQHHQHLRQVLDSIFPPAYIDAHHKHPNSVCSLLSTRCRSKVNTPTGPEEVSSEPSSRASLAQLRDRLDLSLAQHQAKLNGLCPIRRSIYDQCFDELIRQVTVGCIEQGLLLLRVRNELRGTLESYQRVYQSGVQFGLRKAVKAEQKLTEISSQIYQEQDLQVSSKLKAKLKDRAELVELKNKLDSVDKINVYYKEQVALKDQIIEQQRAIISALSEKATGDIRSPI